jgi:NAD+ kinase
VASFIESEIAAGRRLERVGVIVHPSRSIGRPLRQLRGWAGSRGADVVQIPVYANEPPVAHEGDPGDCDLIVSIGGDGTMLAAIRAAVAVDRPVLGVACGSLGVLTAVGPSELPDALDRFREGAWVARRLPALDVARDGRPGLFAFNDIAVVRAGIGQIRVASRVDGALFSRLAGDGCIVSTPVGSSAYTLAAGGPLLTPEADAYLLTPLPTHGGSRQPLVIGAGARLELEIDSGIGGARLEIDGQIAATQPASVTIAFRRAVATLVSFADQEHLFASLRRRRVIVDSPRIVADDERG